MELIDVTIVMKSVPKEIYEKIAKERTEATIKMYGITEPITERIEFDFYATYRIQPEIPSRILADALTGRALTIKSKQ